MVLESSDGSHHLSLHQRQLLAVSTTDSNESRLRPSLDEQSLGTFEVFTDQLGQWKTKTLEDIPVPTAGPAILKPMVEHGEFTLNWIDFLQVDSDLTTISEGSLDLESGVQNYDEYGYDGISA